MKITWLLFCTTVTSNIIPRLQIYSSVQEIYANDGFNPIFIVIFDFSPSFNSSSDSQSAFFLLDFGTVGTDGQEATTGIIEAFSNSSSLLFQKYSYSNPGQFTAILYAQDSPFTAEDLPLNTAAALEITVLDTIECHHFTTQVTFSSNGDALLWIQVAEHFYNGQSQTSTAVSKAFQSIGQTPVVTVSNQTHANDVLVSWDEPSSSWKSTVPVNYLDSLTPVIAQIESLSIGLSGCLVADANVALPFEQILPSAFKAIPDEISLDTMELRQNKCFKNNALLFSKNADYPYIIVTTDSFVSITTLDFTKGSDGSLLSYCNTIDCNNIQIQDALYYLDEIILITNYGYLISNSTSDFVLDFDSLASTETYTVNIAAVNCIQPESSFLIHSYSISNATFVFADTLTSGVLTGISPRQLPSHPMYPSQNFTLIYGIRNEVFQSFIFLLGQAIEGCCGLTSGCCFEKAYFVNDVDSMEASVSFVFPVNQTFTGFNLHENGIDFYIFGATLWHGVTGKYFEQISNNLSENDLFVSCMTSRYSGIAVFYTAANSLYFTRAGSTHVSMANYKSWAGVSNIFLDDVGDVHQLYTNSTSNELQSLFVPLISTNQANLYEIEATLVPRYISREVVRFYIGTDGSSFSSFHKNLLISRQMSSAQSAIIVYVDGNGRYVDTFAPNSFVSDFTSSSGIISISLDIIQSWIQSPLIEFSPAITLTLENDIFNSTFVNHTMLLNSPSFTGSILIVTCLNSTSAIGYLAPDIIRTVSDFSLTFLPSQWSMIDFSPDTWELEFDECGFSTIETNGNSSMIFLQDGANINLGATISSTGSNDEFSVAHTIESDLHPLISNSNGLQIYYQTNINELINQNINVSIDGLNTAVYIIYTPVEFRPIYISPKCLQAPIHYDLYIGCAPYISYGQNLPLNVTSFLTSNLADNRLIANFEMLQELPKNYRPPSKYGRSIPITDNIYNADPSSPLYNNYFSKSKSSGQYKACKGKMSAATCGCTDAQKFSSDPNDTDCNQRVLRVFFNDVYIPQVAAMSDGSLIQLIDGVYSLREINGRTDWCVSNQPTCATALNYDNYGTINSTLGDGVYWMGSELYHFEMTLMQITSCPITIFWKVYVIQPSFYDSVNTMSMAITAVAFAIVFFGIYQFNHNSILNA